ncbi:hypothetical protein [Herbidospora mongoliensis]|uniref:hypothetical protein n=1 Tax=Herbidospora mongoliensis TaxID=688067 RepID=UPI00082A987C|nr:hypothetical protein [Herbidospora mongoliensis]
MGTAHLSRVHRDALLRELTDLHASVGRPSLVDIVKAGADIKAREDGQNWRHLSRSTLSNLMTGKFTRPVEWPLVRTTAMALLQIGIQNGLRRPATLAQVSAFTEKFANLWGAAAAEYGSPGRAEPAMSFVPGDILEQTPQEIRLPQKRGVATRMPRAWGRVGDAIVRRAEEGDPEAAYQAAVLFACEAHRQGLTRRECEEYLGAAKEWWQRAVGKVEQAASFRAGGLALVEAIRRLAFEKEGVWRTIFIQALWHLRQAERDTEDASIAPTGSRDF